MTEIVQVATLKIRGECLEEALALFEPMLAATHAEPGCIKYALHSARAHPETLVMIERWRSEKALLEHRRQPHTLEIARALAPLLAEPISVLSLEPLPHTLTGKGTV